MAIIFTILGSLSLALGILGIWIPGLPTTVFLLIAAYCYLRGSKKLYNWLRNHEKLGKEIREWEQYKAIRTDRLYTALVSMWTAISFSSLFIFFTFKNIWIIISVIAAGITGTIVLLMLPRRRPEKTKP
jgi:uncharacterized membrane protein YbaN (DUF454 family)